MEFKKNVRDLLIRFLPPLKREVGCRRQLGGFHRNLKRTCVAFNPLFASLEKGGGLPQATRRDSAELYGI